MRNFLIFALIAFFLLPLVKLSSKEENPLDKSLSNSKDNSSSEKLDLNNASEIFKVKYNRKNPQLAMVMSFCVPGAGQFYADKSSLTTYIFPVLEAALIGGIIYFDNQGDKLTKDYKKFATEQTTLTINGHDYSGPRYNRKFQKKTAEYLIGIRTTDIYIPDLFKLDETNTNTFYQVIGKYNKFIFGWVDWYATYADPTMLDPDLWPDNYTGFAPQFIYEVGPNDPNYESIDNTWAENYVYGSTTEHHKPYSELRYKYNDLRSDAKNKYDSSHYISFGLAANHIAAAIDAVIVTNNVNRYYLASDKLHFNYYAADWNGTLTPMLALNLDF
ncbi:MAG TPA: hypothetical protein PLF50_02050 [Candidatus Cloacimonadota bacterium]|nr:hypothetical protein [Candidatus Cloacimonadota bacterium]HOV16270.1 hypothetical protein [Candidatus Cloacimonadota bacterium]HQL14466.1 hypothetical protein [Candidatus Cloacimonadota bacterium]